MEMPNEEEKLNEENIEKDNPKKSFQRKIRKLEEEKDKAVADMEHWKNEFYRAYADTKNLRNQLEKDHLAAMKYRAEGFIEELLPVLDSFYAVLKNEPSDPNLKNYLIGFQYIYKNLVHVKGYKLHDRLIRPANVTVSVKKKQDNNETKIDA